MKKLMLMAAAAVALSPVAAHACACGCGVFDVSTGSMMPTSEGGSVWLEYDYLNQTQNWHGTHSAPSGDNTDKLIHTDFITAGGQYMFNRHWGVEAEVPYWSRNFKTQTDDPNPGDAPTFHSQDFGDVRLKAIYTGLSPDMSTGLTLGLKLPTGNFTAENFDRDTQIGTGSTDLLIGAYHMGTLTEKGDFNWFVHGQWAQPVAVQDHYRPGDEINVATGVYYESFDLGKAGKIAPLMQVIGSAKMRDRGVNAHPEDTGYSRLFISPGVEYDINKIKLYTDVELPVAQNVSGNQLVAPVAVKFIVGYSF